MLSRPPVSFEYDDLTFAGISLFTEGFRFVQTLLDRSLILQILSQIVNHQTLTQSNSKILKNVGCSTDVHHDGKRGQLESG